MGAERKDLEVTALDVDSDALKVTEENARLHSVKIKVIQADILTVDRLPDTYNIIVSNPPYVTESERLLMHRNVLDYEPSLALFVDDADPLIFYRQILSLAQESLSADGMVFFEINEQLGAEVVALCRRAGFKRPELFKDMNGKDRIVFVSL
ncbi:MAG: methyltransferase [Cyclobacteriaceae bacterium]|nr:methyltransferase [Cyclobacteriaceae bacterium]